MKTKKRKNRVKPLVLLFDLFTLFIIMFGGKIADFMRDSLPRCWVAEHGIVCPACGATRCVKLFLSGDPITAFFHHPVVFFAMIYGLFFVLFLNLAAFLNVRFAKRAVEFMLESAVMMAGIAVFLLYGLVRNFFPNIVL